MDLDYLDGPTQAPSRSTRFAPKNSKFKPKPKTEQQPSQSQELDSVPLSKKEESLDSIISKVENESLHLSSFAAAKANGNGIVKMDTEANPEGDEPKEDLMEEDNHEEEEDHVVREIDVFFTPSMDFNTQLYVLQYPLKPCWRPYELEERCEEVRVKPATAEVEIDLSVDADSKNYDPDADKRARMTKQILSSSWKPPRRSGYAVGVLIGNKLHLNPIHAVVQLRPSMQHSRSGGSRKNIASHDEDVVKSKEVKEEKSAGPSKKQNKPPIDLNEPCEDLVESWVPLKYHGAKSDVSGRYLHKMVAQEGSHIQFLMSSSDYVNSLCPATSNHIRQRGPSRRYLLSLPLEDRYKTWLLEGPPVHRFDALKHLALSDSVEEVLGVLQKLAYLVQGLWVPKTSLLYGPGVEGLARDYTLYLFSKNHVISYTEIPQKNSIKEAVKKILNVFAVERPAFSDWKFKEPKDMSFVKLHPDIVKEQEHAWESRAELINNQIYGGRSAPGMKKPSKTNMVDRPVTLKNANKSVTNTSNGAPSKTLMSDETREALLKTLQKLFQTHKVCSFQRICQLLRDMATSEANRPKGAREPIAAASSLDSPPEELRAIINQVAIDIHGVFVSKSSPDNSQYYGLRKVVIDLLIVEGPNAKLKKAVIMEAGKMRLKREEIPTAEYSKVMNELCVSQGSVWVLKSGNGPPN